MLSMIAKRNGWSAVNSMGLVFGGKADLSVIMTAVAAAASVPLVSTLIFAACSMAPINRFLLPSMPRKSALLGSKAAGILFLSNDFMARALSISNFGIVILILRDFIFLMI